MQGTQYGWSQYSLGSPTQYGWGQHNAGQGQHKLGWAKMGFSLSRFSCKIQGGPGCMGIRAHVHVSLVYIKHLEIILDYQVFVIIMNPLI